MRTRMIPLLALLLAAPLGGCVAAVGAAAGGAGAVAYTNRGAKAEVKGDVPSVNERAKAVFQEMGIAQTESNTRSSGQEQELKGRSGNADVTVDIKQTAPGQSHVEVVAREGTLKWNKDYAKDILSRIVQAS